MPLGKGGYEADKELVVSLQAALGKGYMISYPEMQWDESAADFGWTKQIGEKIAKADNDLILLGHSFGASMILKYLSAYIAIEKKLKYENDVERRHELLKASRQLEEDF